MKQTAELTALTGELGYDADRIVLVACSKRKRYIEPVSMRPAQDLYSASPLFARAMSVALKIAPQTNVFILSTQYDLVRYNQPLPYYDMSLDDIPAKRGISIGQWGQLILDELSQHCDPTSTEVVILASRRISDALTQGSPLRLGHAVTPLSGLDIIAVCKKLK